MKHRQERIALSSLSTEHGGRFCSITDGQDQFLPVRTLIFQKFPFLFLKWTNVMYLMKRITMEAFEIFMHRFFIRPLRKGTESPSGNPDIHIWTVDMCSAAGKGRILLPLLDETWYTLSILAICFQTEVSLYFLNQQINVKIMQLKIAVWNCFLYLNSVSLQNSGSET